jgi:hypothetical protein
VKYISAFTCALALFSNLGFGIVVQYQVVDAGLTGTAIREIREGKLAGFRYENSFLGTRNFEEGFVKNISTGVPSLYKYPNAYSTQIYAISTTDNNQYGGMAYFGELFPVRVYGFTKESNGNVNIIEPLGASNSSVEGIYGITSVGWYEQGASRYGFLRVESDSVSSFLRVAYNNPLQGYASSTELRGIWGGVAVGSATFGGRSYGFGMSNSEFSGIYSAPGGSSGTYFNDYNDGLIAGTATFNGVNKPFLFNPSTEVWEFFVSPEGYSASGSSYDNGILAGSYVTTSGETLGYYAYVPEPNIGRLVVLALAMYTLFSRKRENCN